MAPVFLLVLALKTAGFGDIGGTAPHKKIRVFLNPPQMIQTPVLLIDTIRFM
jgi:hypothetical protein